MSKDTMVLLLVMVVAWLLLSGRAGAIGGQIMENEETIKWTDILGNERTVLVTRRVVMQ